jgi:HEAT repeat protein
MDTQKGYPISENTYARRLQETLALIADEEIEGLNRTLRDSSDAGQRAAAAYCLAYASDKKRSQEILQYALRDFDPSVRANALQSLGFIADFSQRNPERGVRIMPIWLIEMLNSVVWNDRHRAAEILEETTRSRLESDMIALEDRGRDSILQMSRWQNPDHARPAWYLLGRILNLPEVALDESWQRGDREYVLRVAREKYKERRNWIPFLNLSNKD